MEIMPPSYGERPDRWVIVEIVFPTATERKVFCGSYGGYLGSDDWRLSSRIEKEEEHEDRVEITTMSGSRYTLFKSNHGWTGLMTSVWNGFIERAKRDQPELKFNVLEDYSND